MAPPDHNGDDDSQNRQQNRVKEIEPVDDEKSTSRVDGDGIEEEKVARAGGGSATTMVGAGGGGRQEGWRELKEDGDATTTTTKKRAGGPSDDMENTGSIEIELQETGTTTTRSVRTGKTKLLGSGAGGKIRGLLGLRKTGHTDRAGGDGTADYGNVVSVTASGSPGPDGVAAVQGAGEELWSGEYRVYKRRWFGLLQLMLLNIIASWDVSLYGFFIFLFSFGRFSFRVSIQRSWQVSRIVRVRASCSSGLGVLILSSFPCRNSSFNFLFL